MSALILQRSPAALKATLVDPRATHYAVLGVCPGNLVEDLDPARRALAGLLHPDRGGGEDRRAHDFMCRVNDAHAALEDPAQRKLYDARLLSTHAKCPACAGEGFSTRQRGFKAVARLRCMGCNGEGWVRK